ncbi:MAG: Lipase/esterase [Frankiales bacterium]|nr:Lipase/esterase [Frankiales bacterium]
MGAHLVTIVTTQSNDWPIWWDSIGDGDPVLLLNGLSSPSGTWFRLRRVLAERFRVLTIDNRGTGLTGAPPGHYPIAVFAQDALAVLDAAGVDRVHVVGHSMGGLIAQELALEAPDRVRSLVLAGTHVGVPHARADELTAGPQLVAAGALPPDERIPALNAMLYAPSTPAVLIAEDEAVRAAQPTSAEGYQGQLNGSLSWERLAELPALTMPTLVLHGALDRIVPLSAGERLAAALPCSELTVLPNAAHALFTDAEAEAAALVAAFLRQ